MRLQDLSDLCINYIADASSARNLFELDEVYAPWAHVQRVSAAKRTRLELYFGGKGNGPGYRRLATCIFPVTQSLGIDHRHYRHYLLVGTALEDEQYFFGKLSTLFVNITHLDVSICGDNTSNSKQQQNFSSKSAPSVDSVKLQPLLTYLQLLAPKLECLSIEVKAYSREEDDDKAHFRTAPELELLRLIDQRLLRLRRLLFYSENRILALPRGASQLLQLIQRFDQHTSMSFISRLEVLYFRSEDDFACIAPALHQFAAPSQRLQELGLVCAAPVLQGWEALVTAAPRWQTFSSKLRIAQVDATAMADFNQLLILLSTTFSGLRVLELSVRYLTLYQVTAAVASLDHLTTLTVTQRLFSSAEFNNNTMDYFIRTLYEEDEGRGPLVWRELLVSKLRLNFPSMLSHDDLVNWLWAAYNNVLSLEVEFEEGAFCNVCSGGTRGRPYDRESCYQKLVMGAFKDSPMLRKVTVMDSQGTFRYKVVRRRGGEGGEEDGGISEISLVAVSRTHDTP